MSSVKSIKLNEYASLYRIYRLRQLLYLWSKVCIHYSLSCSVGLALFLIFWITSRVVSSPSLKVIQHLLFSHCLQKTLRVLCHHSHHVQSLPKNQRILFFQRMILYEITHLIIVRSPFQKNSSLVILNFHLMWTIISFHWPFNNLQRCLHIPCQQSNTKWN